MPIVLQNQNSDGSLMALWRISESEEALAARCTQAEQVQASSYKSARRRSEFLAWRAMLHELLPDAEVLYAPSGAPQLYNPQLLPFSHLSVSHGAGYAALLLSSAPCGLDIERTERLSELLPSPELLPVVVWCAKEALYKWAGREGVDFLEDIQIAPLEEVAGASLVGRVRMEGESYKEVALSYRAFEELAIVHTTASY